MTLLQSTQEAEKEILQVLRCLMRAALCCIIILTITNRHAIHLTNTTNNVANEKGKMEGEQTSMSPIFIYFSSHCLPLFFLQLYDVRGECPPPMTY